LAQSLEREARLPDRPEERFAGYGVMGLPFASGHILAMRRWPASSVGPGYSSVWHHAPDGRWTFAQSAPPEASCTRYFGSALAGDYHTDIQIEWTGPRSLRLTAEQPRLEWSMQLAATPATRALNAVGRALPDAMWHSPAVLAAMGRVAGTALRAGRLRLAGQAPNGQRFMSNPKNIWVITAANAVLDGEDLGPLGPVPEQVRLGDFYIPQRGLLAFASAFLEPFDADRHTSADVRAAA